MLGRPSKYKIEYNDLCKSLAEYRLTDEEMSKILKVSKSTLELWKLKHPKFSDSIKKGKEICDARVERALFERAIGYSHPEDKIMQNNGEPVIVPTIRHYPPDPTAMIFWLKNRKPEQWRDKHEQEININNWPDKIKIEIVNKNDSTGN